MRRRHALHRSVLLGTVLSLGLAFLGGCVETNLRPRGTAVPAAPAALYIPPSSLSKPTNTARQPLSGLDGHKLSLAECIKTALSRNPKIRESWQRTRSVAAGLGRARSDYLPSADFTAGVTRGDAVFFDSDRETGTVDTLSAGFGVRYLLFDGGKRSAGVQGAEAELLNVNFQHNATLQDVALKVEEAYYQFLAARALERVARQTIQQTQYHLDVARARYTNGLVARSDVLKAETEKADADLLMVRARSQVRVVHGQLADAMGIIPSAIFDVADLPPNAQQQEAQDVRELMSEAASSRPGLRAALARIESARTRIEAGKARYWPGIMINSAYSRRDRNFVPDHDEWSLGLGITWQLFDGLNREYSIHKARAELKRSEAEYEKLIQGVELEVWTAYSRLTEAGQAIEAANALVASAGENARVTEGQYKNGTASIIEVTDAQTSRTAANVRLVQAVLDRYMALARLERAVGKTLTQENNKVISGEKNK